MKNVIIQVSKSRGNRYHEAEGRQKLPFGWQFAGHTKKSNEKCGLFKRAYACENDVKHFTRVTSYNCKNIGCPVCVFGASAQKAEKSAIRLMSYAEEFDETIKHFSINTNEPIMEYEKLAKHKTKLQRLLKKEGLKCFVLVYHIYRLNKDENKLYISPHFHAIGCGFLTDSQEFFVKHGFTYRNHGSRYTYDEVLGSIAYLINHCACYKNKPSYSVYGLRGKYRLEKIENYPECHECDGKIAELDSDCFLIDGNVKQRKINLLKKDLKSIPSHTFEGIKERIIIKDKIEFLEKHPIVDPDLLLLVDEVPLFTEREFRMDYYDSYNSADSLVYSTRELFETTLNIGTASVPAMLEADDDDL